MGLKVPVPDHTTLSRRAQKWEPSARRNPPLPDGPLHVLVDSTGLKFYGAGPWLEQKHGARSRRNLRKLHLAVDAKTGAIIAHGPTDQKTDDPSQVAPLLDQIDGEIDQFTADGAYDGKPTYRSILQHSATANIVIPPRSTAVKSGDTGPPGQRDKHIAAIASDGRLKWQAATGYGKRGAERNSHRTIQGADRTAPASTLSSGSTDRGCHRLHRSQPHAGMWTPGVCPASIHTGMGAGFMYV